MDLMKKQLNYLKRKNLRLIDSSNLVFKNIYKITSGINSFLIQTNDNEIFNKKNFSIMTKNKPSKNLMEQLLFSLNVCRVAKSNAIVISQNNKTLRYRVWATQST